MAKVIYKNGVTSVILRVVLYDSASTTGGRKTGLTNASSGLNISTIADSEASATAYTSAGSTIDTITTLGTFAAPSANHCRFKEVDSTNHPGLYELQIADARWAVSGAKSAVVTVQCTGAVAVDAELQLSAADLNDGVHLGVSGIPNATPGASGGLLIAGSNAATTFASGSHFIGTVDTVTTVTNQLTGAAIATAVWTDTTSSDFTTTSSPGKIIVAQLGGAFTTVSSSVFSSAALANAPITSAPTVAQIATAVWQDTTASDFITAGSIGKSLFTSGNAPGATSGLALVGSNVGTATSVTGAVGSVTGNVGGNVVGSVGLVTGNVGGNVMGSVGSVSGVTFPINFGALGITLGGKVSEVVLVDTLTTYTNDTPQSGDSFARIGTTGSGLTSLAPSATALSTANWTNARSAYLDNLNVEGAVASHADAVALSAAIAALPQMTGLAPTWYTTPPTASAIALAYLVYDMSTVIGEAAKSPINCLRKLRDWSISGNTLTVYKEDGSTAAYTQILTTANASPITAITG